MGWTATLVQRGRASWARVRALLERAPAVADGPQTDAGLTQLQGAVSFEGVGFESNGREPLSGIDFSIPSGATVGITGPTGSGKTLLVSMIARIVDPTQGRVTIGGRDVREIPLSVLRKHVGMAAQEPVLFSDTLARNIAFGVPDATMDDILWAADVAHLHEDVQTFPRRYDTVLGERGVTLSGGQRQRASISRAIARRPTILILDDVLASVDTETEAAILGKLRPVAAERTTVIVSHRISTLREADFIIVLEDGRVTQVGSHADLVARDGYYRRLEQMQRLASQLETAGE
jgi:ATP-binding cassette subfamily B protein